MTATGTSVTAVTTLHQLENCSNYYGYDSVSGALSASIIDVDYAKLTGPQQAAFDPTGWPEPSGGLHLVSTYDVDPQGRTTRSTDPNGNTTFTVYIDGGQETRTYGGWYCDTTNFDYVLMDNPPPTSVFIDDPATGYSDSLTYSGTPGLTGGLPDGTENLLVGVTLSRSGNTVTACGTGHTFVVGDTVIISGATQAGYNGTFIIASATADSFTYRL